MDVGWEFNQLLLLHNAYTLKTAGSFLTVLLVNYAPTKPPGQNYNLFCSQNNAFHGYFLTPFSKLVHC